MITLLIGIIGLLMIFYSLAQGAITGAVIGTNATSKLFGFFGVVLIIIVIFVERHQLRERK